MSGIFLDTHIRKKLKCEFLYIVVENWRIRLVLENLGCAWKIAL
jgi:hypothetical protein